MNLPQDFIQTIHNVFKEDGKRFIENLPALINEVSARWGLTDVRPVPNLSFNFVAFAKRVSAPALQRTQYGASVHPTSTGHSTDKQDVILKLGVPNRELPREMAALKLFNGEGACQLLESDEEKGFLLLERLKPGKMLSELEDDDERTHIAADVMQRMESASSLAKVEQHRVGLQSFIKLSDWFDGLKKIRPHFNGRTGPFPKKILERVESSLPELFSDKNIGLMHGDFHHFNILSSERGWLVIDPKGVIGPVEYEIGPFMLNPWNSISDEAGFKVQAERRVDIFSERLGWERRRIIQWSLAHAILSAWWNIEDGMKDEYALQCAKVFSELK